MNQNFGLAILDKKEQDEIALLEEVLKREEVKGYRILLRAPFTKEGKFSLPHQTKADNARHAEVGKVIKLGDCCYYNEPGRAAHFPKGAWCQPGDWVFFGNYEAELIRILGFPCFFANDNRVFSVIHPDNYPYILEGKA